MIRPLTIATCLLACGSGLYVYQSKHEVQLLDRTIERTVRDTGVLRDQSRLLAAEWTMLNDPDRLRQFSDTYLSLKSTAPPQYTSLADLGSRLPPQEVEVAAPATDEPDTGPVASETAPQPIPEPETADVAQEDLPLPPIQAPLPAAPAASVVASVAASPGHPADAKAPDHRALGVDLQAHPAVVADSRPVDQRVPEQHPVQHVVDAQAAPAASPRPIVLASRRPLPANAPMNRPMVPAPQPRPGVVAVGPNQMGSTQAGAYGGSLLGMARGSMPPAPRPTPVSAIYNSN